MCIVESVTQNKMDGDQFEPFRTCPLDRFGDSVIGRFYFWDDFRTHITTVSPLYGSRSLRSYGTANLEFS